MLGVDLRAGWRQAAADGAAEERLRRGVASTFAITGRSSTLRRRRPHSDRQQRDRAVDEAGGDRTQGLALRRQRGWWRAERRMLTLVSSALRNDLDVWVYVKDVLDQLLAGRTDYDRLLPDVWKRSHPEAIRQYRVAERRDKAEAQATRSRPSPSGRSPPPDTLAPTFYGAGGRLLRQCVTRLEGQDCPESHICTPRPTIGFRRRF